MPIDPDLARGTVQSPVRSHWDGDRVILYHLGLGAGSNPRDEREVRYVDEQRLHVLPTFAVVPASESSAPLLRAPGLDHAARGLLQVAQRVQLHAVVPTAASVCSRSVIEAVWDKGRAAIVVLRTDTTLDDGTPLATAHFTLYLRGSGGFGGDPGPSIVEDEPSAPPDFTLVNPTLPQQAAIYRLGGDRHRLHVDPGYARAAGFDGPTLPGLCTWGVVAKAVVDHVLDGDVTALRSFEARFAGPVYPGETLITEGWRRDATLYLRTTVAERATPALAGGRMEIR